MTASLRDKAIALNFSRPLELHRWSDKEHVDECTSELLDTLISNYDLMGQRKLLFRHLKVIVLDAFRAWSQSRDLYIHFGRSKTFFANVPKRYNNLNIGHKAIDVIDALYAANFIEYHKGFQDKHGFITARYSRFKAREVFINQLKTTYGLSIDDIHIRNKESIILRDWIDGPYGTYKKDIDYIDSQLRGRYRKHLSAYNKLLKKSTIRISNVKDDFILLKDGETKRAINHNDNFVRRIFSNGQWNQGGRFHGGWWQQLPGTTRRLIKINGSTDTVTEVDYSSLHIVLLYALNKIDFHSADPNDAYSISDYQHLYSEEELRILLKLILLICINAKDRKSAIKAITFEINKDHEKYEWFTLSGIEIEDIIDRFLERHHLIKNYFFSNYGIKLQFIDSNIAEKVINHFTKKDIPVLAVHDSFLIDPLYENELVILMTDSFKREMKRMGVNFSPEIKLKLTTSHMDQIKN